METEFLIHSLLRQLAPPAGVRGQVAPRGMEGPPVLAQRCGGLEGCGPHPYRKEAGQTATFM